MNKQIMTIRWGRSVACFADNGNQGLAPNYSFDDGLIQDMNYGSPDLPDCRQLP